MVTLGEFQRSQFRWKNPDWTTVTHALLWFIKFIFTGCFSKKAVQSALHDKGHNTTKKKAFSTWGVHTKFSPPRDGNLDLLQNRITCPENFIELLLTSKQKNPGKNIIFLADIIKTWTEKL